MQVQLREYHKSDFNELEGIIRQTWHYDEFASPKIATKLARVFLTSCLTNYTFSRVAVSSECRGKGIGKMLFQSALEYMKQEKLDNFYLFTDTSCNYGFYEHQGMERCVEKEHIFNIKGQRASMKFFIYEYLLSVA